MVRLKLVSGSISSDEQGDSRIRRAGGCPEAMVGSTCVDRPVQRGESRSNVCIASGPFS